MYRVRAINASGASAFSNIACPRCVYTEGGKYPQVTMTSPANSATINSGASIILTADATDEDGEGTLIKVEFFQLTGSGANSRDSAGVSPCSVVLQKIFWPQL
jgi:hypothetical protein